LSHESLQEVVFLLEIQNHLVLPAVLHFEGAIPLQEVCAEVIMIPRLLLILLTELF
jgi:hypothetical protein